MAGLGSVCPEGALLFSPLCLPSLSDPLRPGVGTTAGKAPIGQEAARLVSKLPGPPGEEQGLHNESPPPMPAPPLHPVPAATSREDEPRGWKEIPRWSPVTWIHELLTPPPSISFPANLQTS